ncbi:DUF1868 domain-containing protein [Vibrio sp. SS-MA-C1-2]|uniref:DUF1868 domain-containing protein n=1 Tax=Vibrio sp. SS-MA-C1-2 TaxID=2908646 RepID=UPI001F2664A8|nr:DUF1868 domain-containing protein [Vibrio sp. SS-MA-C1-2]UJF17987.1 DUF1868 domain-containing protein [Vibrio sp. SS-MA-C1-2]
MTINYAPAVDFKFHKDGTVRTFKGNTFLCHLDQTTETYKTVVWAQEQLKAMKCADNYAFLPTSSFHMTVFEGLCDQVRDEADLWSSKLTNTLSIEETTEIFKEWISDIKTPRHFELVFDAVVNTANGGTLLRIKPANNETTQAITACREKISEATGIRHAVHDEYFFHVTLSYKIVHLDDVEQQELADTCQRITERLQQEFGTVRHNEVEYCYFDNMFKFDIVKKLAFN